MIFEVTEGANSSSSNRNWIRKARMQEGDEQKALFLLSCFPNLNAFVSRFRGSELARNEPKEVAYEF